MFAFIIIHILVSLYRLLEICSKDISRHRSILFVLWIQKVFLTAFQALKYRENQVIQNEKSKVIYLAGIFIRIKEHRIIFPRWCLWLATIIANTRVLIEAHLTYWDPPFLLATPPKYVFILYQYSNWDPPEI